MGISDGDGINLRDMFAGVCGSAEGRGGVECRGVVMSLVSSRVDDYVGLTEFLVFEAVRGKAADVHWRMDGSDTRFCCG